MDCFWNLVALFYRWLLVISGFLLLLGKILQTGNTTRSWNGMYISYLAFFKWLSMCFTISLSWFISKAKEKYSACKSNHIFIGKLRIESYPFPAQALRAAQRPLKIDRASNPATQKKHAKRLLLIYLSCTWQQTAASLCVF